MLAYPSSLDHPRVGFSVTRSPRPFGLSFVLRLSTPRFLLPLGCAGDICDPAYILRSLVSVAFSNIPRAIGQALPRVPPPMPAESYL